MKRHTKTQTDSKYTSSHVRLGSVEVKNGYYSIKHKDVMFRQNNCRNHNHSMYWLLTVIVSLSQLLGMHRYYAKIGNFSNLRLMCTELKYFGLSFSHGIFHSEHFWPGVLDGAYCTALWCTHITWGGDSLCNHYVKTVPLIDHSN